MDILRTRKGRFAALATAGTLAIGGIGVPAASAQPQTGLVNVNIEDVSVVVPIAIAANICNVPVNVLVADLRQDNTAECNADAGTGTVTIGQ